MRVVRIGKRGTLVLPADLRRHYEMDEGALIIMEPGEGGVFLRPATVVPKSVADPAKPAD